MRYARALLQYATDEKVEDKIYAGMKQLLSSFKEVNALHHVLTNPTIANFDKIHLIEEAVGSENCTQWKNFARLVVHQQRTDMLPYIAHAYINLYRQAKGIFSAKLTTASPLTEEMLTKIKEKIIDKTQAAVELSEEVDSTLEGGFIFQVGSNRLDASIRNQLWRVKKQFVERNRRII